MPCSTFTCSPTTTTTLLQGKQYGYAPPQVSVSAHAAPVAAATAATDFDSDAVRGEPTHNNNYSRAQGQNVG